VAPWSTGERQPRRTGKLARAFEGRVAGASVGARALTRGEGAVTHGAERVTFVEEMGELQWTAIASRRRA
jgi:hypothetical protein